ncbi:type VI secretion system Vgr family protein [Aquimarina hainanensis]|uniref:Type VI secretion system Vgr family protein n=1 Tax=Aquimarina hainanensis TaxID=1578017 RepID=A0ABW5NDL7_9FLAO
MATLSNTQIAISGRVIPSFRSLSIQQHLGDHHHLELVCRTDVLEHASDEIIGDSKDLLGETIIVQVQAEAQYQDYRELQFKGLITAVNATKAHQSGASGDIVIIEAMSTTILADDGIHTTSYMDLDLTELLERTYQGYDVGKLATAFAPRQSDTIHYSVQKNESNFAYSARLAASTNNWFYYDGVQLVFGTPSNEETQLVYGRDLESFSVRMRPTPNKFAYTTQDYLTNELYQKRSSEVATAAAGYHSLATNKGNVLYSKETNIYHHGVTDQNLQQRFEQQVEFHTQAIESKQVIAHGVSDNPGIQLGAVVRVEGYGSFRVIEVRHTNIEGGNYKNHFQAITTEIDVYPLATMLQHPVSTIEIGKVTDNADPEGMSRVKVQFPFQEITGETTPWIRVLTPHAGADKGFHFIPEIGETVVCQFENNHSERPYVAGSLYHGVAKAENWQSEQNNVKAIRTRSGHTIELNDTEGEEKINIYDNDGSIITFDTQAKSLTINATEDINISAKNVHITAEENITLGAQQNVEVAAETAVKAISQGTVELQSEADTTVRSNAALAIEASSDMTAKGQNAIVEGLAGAELNSPQTKVSGSAMTEVSGGILKLN